MAYLWTAEWHKSDHGLHVHFAVGRYISRQVIERAWGRGFVHIKHLSDLPVRLDVAGQSRQAARYLSKYVGKAIDERRVPGLHRYEVARGFQPQSIRLYGRTVDEVLDVASQHMGDGPAYEWSSSEALDWQGPPAVWVMGRLTDDAMAAWVAALRRHVRVLACRSDQQSTSKADAAHSA